MAIIALIAYVILRNNSYPDWILELFLFNFVALLSIFSLKLSRIPDDQLARIGVATALGFWTVGSLISSLDTYFRIPIEFNLDLVSEICYVLFYPAALFGFTRAIRNKVMSRSLELLDTLIIALGCTTILSAFLIRPAMTEIQGTSFQVFLAILYPVGDIVLFVSVFTLSIVQR